MKIISTQHVAEEAGKVLEELLRNETEPFLLLLSGGSAFEVLKYVPTNALNKRTTIGMLDERYHQGIGVNNFAQFMCTDFFDRACTAGVTFLNSQVRDGETFRIFTERFKNNLEKHLYGNVIALMGIGEDGHTAGVFPCEDKTVFEELFEQEKKVVGYNAGDKNEFSLRVTVTASFLKNDVTHALVYVVGQNKRKTLESVVEAPHNIHEVPGRIIHSMKDVILTTDIEITS